MVQRSVCGGECLSDLSAPEELKMERQPYIRQTGVVAQSLQRRYRLVESVVGVADLVQIVPANDGAPIVALIAEHLGDLDCFVEHRRRLFQVAEVVQRYGICGQELRVVALIARQQGKGALQQPSPSVHVTSIDRSLAGVGEELSSAKAQFFPGLVEWAKLRLEPIRLLEVVTQNLLVLDLASTGRPRKPSGKTLVQLSSIMLRQRLIGCVPNQQMPELEGVVAGEV